VLDSPYRGLEQGDVFLQAVDAQGQVAKPDPRQVAFPVTDEITQAAAEGGDPFFTDAVIEDTHVLQLVVPVGGGYALQLIRPLEEVDRLLDRIGIVLQDGGIEGELTVAEAIEAQRRPYRSPMSADEAIDLVDLREKRDQRIKRLSGGQRRRLDLALGMVGNPDLLFLDEPTTGFDPAARRRSWEAIRGLSAKGTTVVLTTHYLEEAQELADRVIVMAGGRIVADGPPDTLGERNPGVATIRFTVDPLRATDLGMEAVDGRVEIETDDPVRTIHEITTKALDNDIPLRNLEVSRLSLEEAYLRLVSPRE
jgi:ABC-2 type transport system ATP-binding protein